MFGDVSGSHALMYDTEEHAERTNAELWHTEEGLRQTLGAETMQREDTYVDCPLDQLHRKRREEQEGVPRNWTTTLGPLHNHAKSVLLMTAYTDVDLHTYGAREVENECLQVTGAAFPDAVQEPAHKMHKLWKRVHEMYGYRILGLWRVENWKLWTMHKHFGEVYKIEKSTVLYHASTLADAASIAQSGVRGGCVQAMKLGWKGVCSWRDVGSALKLATPEAGTQTLVIMEALEGRKVNGALSNVAFGEDAKGRGFMTKTNRAGNMAMVQFDAQLLATHILTLSIDHDKQTKTTEERLGGFHSKIREERAARGMKLG